MGSGWQPRAAAVTDSLPVSEQTGGHSAWTNKRTAIRYKTTTYVGLSQTQPELLIDTYLDRLQKIIVRYISKNIFLTPDGSFDIL